MVLDGMDGRVARMTHTQSAFGEQFDSLSDMVSFGRRAGARDVRVDSQRPWALGLAGGLRLLRGGGAAPCPLQYENRRGRQTVFPRGMPSPAAAALIAGFVWLATDNRVPLKLVWLPWVAFVLTIYAGVTMVSNAPFYSGKGARRATSRTVCRDPAGGGRVRAGVVRPAADAVWSVRAVRPVGLRFWGYQAVRGRANPARSSPRPREH